MARLPRVALPGCVHHVMQRGNNGQRIFETAADYQRMLDLLSEHSRTFGVAVHAYVLMANQFHLLVTPHAETGLPQMMQAVGRQYVRYFNDAHRRTGTLWDGGIDLPSSKRSSFCWPTWSTSIRVLFGKDWWCRLANICGPASGITQASA